MDSHVFNPPALTLSPENMIPATTKPQAVVSIRNLQLPAVIAPNIWHEIKEQPALASVSLWLHDSFTSAASQDALDDSTVHYGELSKRIRAVYADEEGQRSAVNGLFEAAEHMARKPNADGISKKSVAKRIAAKLSLPKASAFGDELALSEVRLYDRKGAKLSNFVTFSCKNLRIPTLIGVNAYERKGRQPLVVDFAVDFVQRLGRGVMEQMQILFPLERELVEIIEKTDFETLEKLVEHTFKELRPVFDKRGVKPLVVHLRFEKPCAVPFADGPVIEVHQPWV